MKISTPSDIAHSDAVKQVQSAKGSRSAGLRKTEHVKAYLASARF